MNTNLKFQRKNFNSIKRIQKKNTDNLKLYLQKWYICSKKEKKDTTNSKVNEYIPKEIGGRKKPKTPFISV